MEKKNKEKEEKVRKKVERKQKNKIDQRKKSQGYIQRQGRKRRSIIIL